MRPREEKARERGKELPGTSQRAVASRSDTKGRHAQGEKGEGPRGRMWMKRNMLI